LQPGAAVSAATTAGMARIPSVIANETRRRGAKRLMGGAFLLLYFENKHLTAAAPSNVKHVTTSV
jgi:hypothetical protein